VNTCDKARELFLENPDNEKALEHISSCEDCKKALEKEAKIPPENISAEEWDAIIEKLSTEGKSELKLKDETLKLPARTYMDSDDSVRKSFVSGLKWGLFLALAFVIGIAATQIRNEIQIIRKEEARLLEQIQAVSPDDVAKKIEVLEELASFYKKNDIYGDKVRELALEVEKLRGEEKY